VATPRLRLTLLGVGAMNSPRFAPAGLLVRCGDAAIAIDGGPGAEPPQDMVAWLVTDEHAELRAAPRRLAGAARHADAAGHAAGITWLCRCPRGRRLCGERAAGYRRALRRLPVASLRT